MSSNEKLKCRTVRAILCYHEPNPDKYPQKYAHHLLFTFYPFRNEDNLKLDGSYFAKLQQSGVLDIINLNRQKLNPYSKLVNDALLNLQRDVRSNCDFNHGNDEIEQNILNCVDSLCEGHPSLSENTVISKGEMSPVVSDEELNEHISLLNKKQREVFNTLYSWSVSYMKNFMSQNIATIQPLYLFVTGGAGVGKSFLTNILYQSLTKTFFLQKILFE